ncbi:hypothetical protein LCGC14_0313210 [marine sediment metagenome]|uniref:Uncharacterized protein n=1 Tax=marine sediment metagenome TaxID=412755 RepID=A0A0F9TRU2_9ZZZZ
MGRINFQVSYNFLLGLLNAPEGSRILDVQRGSVPNQFRVMAEMPEVEGEVELHFDIARAFRVKGWEVKNVNRST